MVVVADGHAHAVASVTHPRLLGDVDEAGPLPAVVGVDQVVAKQAVDALVTSGSRRQGKGLNGVDIQISIAVVVEQPAAGSGDLREEVFAGRPRRVNEIEPRLGGDIHKPGLLRSVCAADSRRGPRLLAGGITTRQGERHRQQHGSGQHSIRIAGDPQWGLEA